VARILVAGESAKLRAEILSVLDASDEAVEVSSGLMVAPTVAESDFDLVVADLQIGNMGAVAICLNLRLEESGGRLPHVPVLMLLDRRADVFMARRSGAEGWLVKPLDSIRLRRAVRQVAGGGEYHDNAYTPVPVLVAGGAED
jgi:DNA-binding response OmpR family regulator